MIDDLLGILNLAIDGNGGAILVILIGALIVFGTLALVVWGQWRRRADR